MAYASDSASIHPPVCACGGDRPSEVGIVCVGCHQGYLCGDGREVMADEHGEALILFSPLSLAVTMRYVTVLASVIPVSTYKKI